MDRVLLVDDEQNIRETLHLMLEELATSSRTAADGPEALQLLETEGPFALVISDMRMPKMSGVELLSAVKERYPDTVRMMLTGYGDLETAMDAVNEGNIFRFLTKPCPKKVFFQAVQAGIEQYRLITAEKDLLARTLKGSIKLMTELLHLTDERVFGLAVAIREAAKIIAAEFKEIKGWEMEMAAMLCQIGLVTLPAEVLQKIVDNEVLDIQEKMMFERIPEVGCRLLSHIPRLERVATFVRYSFKSFNGSGPPPEPIQGEKIPIESRILKVLLDLAAYQRMNLSFESALLEMRYHKSRYDPQIINLIAAKNLSLVPSREIRTTLIMLSELLIGDVLVSDIRSRENRLLLSAGSKITDSNREKLFNYYKIVPIKEPFSVFRKEEAAANTFSALRH